MISSEILHTIQLSAYFSLNVLHEVWENTWQPELGNFENIILEVINIDNVDHLLVNPFYDVSIEISGDYIGRGLLHESVHEIGPQSNMQFSIASSYTAESYYDQFITYVNAIRNNQVTYNIDSYLNSEGVLKTTLVPDIEYNYIYTIRLFHAKTMLSNSEVIMSIEGNYTDPEMQDYIYLNPPKIMRINLDENTYSDALYCISLGPGSNFASMIYFNRTITEQDTFNNAYITWRNDEPEPPGPTPSDKEILNKVIVNKISKNKYDILVNNGTISEEMIKEQIWLFTDDQFVSSDNIINWNNKADYNNVYSKSEINDMFSNVNSDINNINSTIGDIATVLSTLTIPTQVEQELRRI